MEISGSFLCEIAMALGTCTHILKAGDLEGPHCCSVQWTLVGVLPLPLHFYFGQTTFTPEFLRELCASKFPAL